MSFKDEICGLEGEEVFRRLGTGMEGLSSDEVRDRLGKYGPNLIERIKKKSILKSFGENFIHLMAILLWTSGLLAFAAGLPQLGVAVWLVNIINGSFSFWQEFKAEKATEALLKVLPRRAHVIRGGEEVQVPASEIVPGDLLVLNDGDHVPADARVVHSFSLALDESSLTGESRPVYKSAEPLSKSNRQGVSNLIFAGTYVVSGRANAIVYGTGMQTSFGTVAGLTQSIQDEISPLQVEMRRVTRTVTLLSLSIGLTIFFLSCLIGGEQSWRESFIFALGMIVAFVPEGMLPTITLSLALSVQKMVGRNALVKQLSAVETLGCTTVICSDKTGTITQNKMTVIKLWTADGGYDITGDDYSPTGAIVPQRSLSACAQDSLLSSLNVCCHCINARLLPPGVDGDSWSVKGDPTEGALAVLARKGGITLDSAEYLGHRICEFSFDSHRQRMSTVYDVGGKRIVYLKGAPSRVIDLCTSIRQDGKVQLLNEDCRRLILEANDELAREGLRVLALADRELSSSVKHLSSRSVEQNLTFCGLVAMVDPPHQGVQESIGRCRSAGIKVIMITGDYGLTAEHIAREVGIIDRPGKVISGEAMETMDDFALRAALGESVIFARVLPEQKYRIVCLLQDMGHIVAVTGDGVNDAPALRKADIGVAMGVTGTDVAKEAADMILLDDNFSTIVNAVELGRTVYSNVQKFAVYVFTSNMAEAVPFVTTLFSRGAIPLGLNVMQVLAIDLGTDMVPALALGAEPPESSVMSSPPRDRTKPLLSKALLVKALLWYGLIEAFYGVFCYFCFAFSLGGGKLTFPAPDSVDYNLATTFTLSAIVLGQVAAVLCCRQSTGSIFSRQFFSNPFVFIAIGLELILLLAILYVPWFQKIFSTAGLMSTQWFLVAGAIPFMIALDECRKYFSRKLKSEA